MCSWHIQGPIGPTGDPGPVGREGDPVSNTPHFLLGVEVWC